MYVFSDSVLWFGSRCEEFPQSVQSWSNKIGWSVDSTPCRELDNIYRVEFEWRISQALTTGQVLDEVQTHPFNFKERTTCLCRITLTFTGTRNETKEGANSVSAFSCKTMGSSSDQETPIGTGHLLHTWWEVEQPCGRNDEHICRKATSYVQVLKSIVPKCFEKLKKWKNIHSLFRESRDSRIPVGKIIAVNQLKIYGAMAKWYNKYLPFDQK